MSYFSEKFTNYTMVIQADGQKAKGYYNLTFFEKRKAQKLYSKNKGRAVFLRYDSLFDIKEITI